MGWDKGDKGASHQLDKTAAAATAGKPILERRVCAVNQLLSMDARFHYGTEIALTVKRRTRSRVILTVALERRLSQSFCCYFFIVLCACDNVQGK